MFIKKNQALLNSKIKLTYSLSKAGLTAGGGGGMMVITTQ
jgi:hypothetical protein